jgi:hypothetical protein
MVNRCLTFIILILIIASCKKNHLINNIEYLSNLDNAFLYKKELAGNRKNELFSVFEEKLSVEQAEALKFLIAFSPLNDLADYNGDFFLANADLALKTRVETRWGKDIPEDIFLHYVLPFRVNNENLDSFRIVFYNEIQNRINGFNETSAALEINHWCHEKVSYQPADIRTSGPMSTILSGQGRCGEESTFTVAALRTAGIPARQVYTPRWAHSDDNHAWVEVWIGGKWYYMGACEPEPVLDIGWFTEYAKRAMLVHTKSFGASTGNENAIMVHKNFSEVNNLSKYAVTKNIFVRILDSADNPVKDAIVEYQLYNYAEFYPLAVVPTDTKGLSWFETGLGDLIIWARKGNTFDFRKISVNDVDTISLKLNSKNRGNSLFEFDLTVPVVRAPTKGPAEQLIAENRIRINEENRIRQKYIDTWMKPDAAEALALKTGLDPILVKDVIARSMGNFKSISFFLESSPADKRIIALSLLKVLSDKDLRDTPSKVLSDHLIHFKPLSGEIQNDSIDFYYHYVLNPRIANEILSPYRGYFQKNLPENIIANGKNNPNEIVKYILENIKISDTENYYGTPITPIGVNDLKVSDLFSRDIFFVAICRSLGIPSRLEPASKVPQYYAGARWNDVYFSDSLNIVHGKSYLRLVSNDLNPVPEYHIHFTLARFENGRYNTLEYDYNRKVSDFKDELSISPGHYMLVTGNRISESKILSSIRFFDISENEHMTLKIGLKKDISPGEILGSFNLKTRIMSSENKMVSLDSVSSRGLVILWIDPEKEPTKHILNDLPLLKSELDNWGGYFIFLKNQTGNEDGFNSVMIKNLPLKSLFSSDPELTILKSSISNCSLANVKLPYIILVSNKGDIIYKSEGYRIGIGEQLLKKITH